MKAREHYVFGCPSKLRLTYHNDTKIKQDALDMVSLMTPVVKSLFSDMGMEITSDAMQIFGGYGYTKDQGIEQLYRDNRITPIYEGTILFKQLIWILEN